MVSVHPSTPAFSIVIPLHNKEPHIARALRSVLDQTWQDLEILVVDDASTDGSVAEVKAFADPRIRLLNRSTPGPGGYAARNLGIREARAKWVGFLDADDEWFPDHLMEYRALIEGFPQSMVLGCGWDIHNPQGLHAEWYSDVYYTRHHRKGTHAIPFADYLRAEVAGARPIWTSIACIDRHLLAVAGGFPEGRARRGGDVDTWLRCIERAGSLTWSAHIGGIYHRDAVNMVTNTELSTAACERDTIQRLLPEHNRETARLLKRFSNRRAIGSWKQRASTGCAARSSLAGELYIGADPVRATFWLLMSYFPISVFRTMQHAIQRIKRYSRRLYVGLTGSRRIAAPRTGAGVR